MKVLPIAKITFREALRSKALLIPALFGAIVLATTPFTPAFTSSDRVRVMLSVCTAAITLFTSIVAVFVSTASVTREIASKRLYTVLTRPVTRLEYVAGKLAGLWAVLALILILMGGLAWVITEVTAVALLSPREREAVLAADVHLYTSTVDYHDRTAKQVRYRARMAEYERLLSLAKEMYAEGLIPAGFKLKDLLEILAMSDEDLAASFPGTDPRALKAGVGAVLARLTGEDHGTDAAAWQEYFRKHPHFGRKPRNPDHAVELPAAEADKFFRWDFGGLDEEVLARGLRCQLTAALFRDPKSARFAARDARKAEISVALEWGGRRFEKKLEIFDRTKTDFVFEGEETPPPGEPFSITITTLPGPTSVVVGTGSLWVLKGPGSFTLNMAKGLFLSWCVAALLAAVGLFGSCFLSFPVALLLCLFVFFWGNTVEYMRELAAPTAENPLLEGAPAMDAHRSNDFLSALADKIAKGAGWLTGFLSKGMEDFSQFEGGRYIPQGLAIPNGLLADALLKLLAWRAALLVLLGWLLFRRREF